MTRPPGARLHLAVLGALAVVAAVIAVVWLASDSRHYAATNSAAPRDWVTAIDPGQRLCVTRLWMPAGSNEVRMRLGTLDRGNSRVSLRLSTPQGTRAASALVTAANGEDVGFRLTPLPRDASVRLCLRTDRPLGGVAGTPFLVESIVGPVAQLDGKPIPHRVSVWFLEPHERSLASELPDAVRRAALFRAGFVGSWTYVALLALLPVLWFAGLRALIGSPR